MSISVTSSSAPDRNRLLDLLLTCALVAAPTLCLAADSSSTSAQGSGSGLYFKVQLSHSAKMSKLRPHDAIEGTLARDVYTLNRKLFPAGSHVALLVDHLEKRRSTPNDHWPWIVNLFTPRHENYPVFNRATVADGDHLTPLQVSLITVTRMREVHAKAKKDSGAEKAAVQLAPPNPKKPATPTLVLEAFGVGAPASSGDAVNEDSSRPDDLASLQTIPAGTRCKILLLGSVSASKSRPGDLVQARLLEPVLLNEQLVLPAGTLFEGNVIKRTPPRRLSRAGSLYLTFTHLTLPGGNRFPVAASLAGAEVDRRSHTRIDAEGGLHGERPGKAWMAINLGMTAGISKEIDDGLQLVIEALVSTATDASTAGAARIVSSCVSGIYLATRRGRDVVLPRFTEMDISLDRPVSLSPISPTESAALPTPAKIAVSQQ